MKLKYNFLNPLLTTILAFSCLLAVLDMAYGVRAWEQDAAAWGRRGLALVVMLIAVVICYFFFNYLIRVFLERDKGNTPRVQIREYLLVIVFILIVLNISMYVVVYHINDTTYRWGEALLMNATALPIFLLYYTSIRNNVLARNYTEKIIQFEKLKVNQLETELKLLRSQYHPHFLFNALNTVYFQIDEENEAAIESIDLLSSLLRYQLYDINAKVTIRQEIDYLETYMRFQRLRMTEQLRLESSFDTALTDQKIHPLLFQPLLENAFKYVGGDYRIEIRMWKEDSKVRFMARNTIVPDTTGRKDGGGIGIDNLKKRLSLLYPDKHSLRIMQDSTCFTVDLWIDLSE